MRSSPPAADASRLELQGQLYNAGTRCLLVEAGIGPGMRVLDVGCGVGDVSLTAAKLVGPSGSITGIDCSPSAVTRARERAGDVVDFLVADAEQTPFGRQFDAVIGRFVIRGFDDAAATLRHLVGRVRAGGLVVLQEKLLDVPVRSYPPNPVVDRVWRWTDDIRRAAGIDRTPGARLPGLYRTACLDVLGLRVDAPAGGGAGWTGYASLAEGLRSMLPLAERLGIAPVQAAGIDDLAEQMAVAACADSVVTLAPSVGAWARVGD